MTVRAAAIVLLVAAAAGCGGQPDHERWASEVDEICRTTREGIAARGYAKDLIDLEQVAERAGADVHDAIERIRKVPISGDARSRVQGFLAELEQLEPRLREMTETTADGALKPTGKLGLRLADATQVLQREADAAGLRECADKRQFDAVLNAFTAPVYATQIGRFEIWFIRQLQRLGNYLPPWSSSFARHLRRVGAVLEEAERRIEDLYVYRPNRAVEASDDVRFALDSYETYVSRVAESLRGGRYLTRRGVNQFNRDVRELRRKLDRALSALGPAIGAQPIEALDPEKTTT